MKKKLAGYLLALSLGCAFGMSNVEAAKQPVKPVVKKQDHNAVKTASKTAGNTNASKSKAGNPLAKYKTASNTSEYNAVAKRIGNKLYLFDSANKVYRKRYLARIGGDYYYFNKDHSLYTGLLHRKDGNRYFKEWNGRQVSNDLVDIKDKKAGQSKTCLFGTNGKQVSKPGWHSIRFNNKNFKVLIMGDGSLRTKPYNGKHGARLFTGYGILWENGPLHDIRRRSKARDVNYYYIAKDGQWIRRQGWIEVNGKKYYVQKGGTILNECTKKIGKKTYRFGNMGELLTNTTYLLNAGKKNAKRVYIDHNSNIVTKAGVYTPKDTKGRTVAHPVYIQKDGSVYNGWKEIKGSRYYFGMNGRYENRTYAGDEDYGYNTDGCFKIDDKYYLFDRNGKLLKHRGVKNIGGLTYKFNNDYSLRSGRFTHGKNKQISEFGNFYQGFGSTSKDAPAFSANIRTGLVYDMPRKKDGTYAYSNPYDAIHEAADKHSEYLIFFDKNGNLKKWTGKHVINGYEFNFGKDHRVRVGRNGLIAKYKGKRALIVNSNGRATVAPQGLTIIDNVPYSVDRYGVVTKLAPGKHTIQDAFGLSQIVTVSKTGRILAIQGMGSSLHTALRNVLYGYSSREGY